MTNMAAEKNSVRFHGSRWAAAGGSVVMGGHNHRCLNRVKLKNLVNASMFVFVGEAGKNLIIRPNKGSKNKYPSSFLGGRGVWVGGGGIEAHPNKKCIISFRNS